MVSHVGIYCHTVPKSGWRVSLPVQKTEIAVARDPAFNFIYRENIARLAELGHITYFSPVYGSDLPEADLLYLPGDIPNFLPASYTVGRN